MNYKLYYATGSASMGVRVLLEEIGVPYELIDSTIDLSKPRLPEQLAINPNGWIPVLQWGDNAMYECAAITIFLCDRHPKAGLAPDVNNSSDQGQKRALFLQTLVYFSNSVQNAYQMTYYPYRFANEAEGYSSAEQRGVRRLRETWGVINDQIGDNQWIIGDNFSAADIYLFMLTTWISVAKGHPSIDEFPNVKRIAEAVQQRPSVQKVYADWISAQNNG